MPYRNNRIFLTIILTLITVLNINAQTEEKEKETSLLKTLWGESIENSVTFMPLGTHYIYDPDIFTTWYTSVTIKSFEVLVFLNSKRDWTTGLFYKRAIPISEKFTLNYGGGLLYGYDGKLEETRGIPKSLHFLFSGPINPVVGLGFDYKISKKLSIHADLAPLTIIYGCRLAL